MFEILIVIAFAGASCLVVIAAAALLFVFGGAKIRQDMKEDFGWTRKNSL